MTSMDGIRFLNLEDFFLRRPRRDSLVTPSMYLNRKLRRIDSPDTPKRFQPRVVVVRDGYDITAWDLMNTLLAILQKDREQVYRLDRPLYVFTNHFVDFTDYISPELFNDLKRSPYLTERGGVIGLSDLSAFTSLKHDNPELLAFVKSLIRRDFDLIGLTKTPDLLSPAFLSQMDFYVECAPAKGGRGIESWWWDWQGATSRGPGARSGTFPPIRTTMDFYAKCAPARGDRGIVWSRWNRRGTTSEEPKAAHSGTFPPIKGTHDYSIILARDKRF